MISIIICSRCKDIRQDFRDNIEKTIGTEHEWVIIDNSQNHYNIFQAYNEGLRRATGDVLCFVHDDVLFHTCSWGAVITQLFSDATIGLIGVAGSHIVPTVPMYWWMSPFISQYNLETSDGIQKTNNTTDRVHDGLSNVAVIDGLCMFMPRKVANKVRFDEKTFSGFHAYDMDISMQVLSAGFRVCVTNKILVEHFWSEKQLKNKRYIALLEKNMRLFVHKWENCLPITKGLDDLPTLAINHILRLYDLAYDATCARQSKAYRIGRILLTPFKWIFGKL